MKDVSTQEPKLLIKIDLQYREPANEALAPTTPVGARTDARGNVTRYEYDANGRVTKMTDANGGVYTYDYCASIGGGSGASCSSCGGGGGSFCELTDPNGNIIKQEFDIMGRVVKVTDSLERKCLIRGQAFRSCSMSGNAWPLN